MPKPRILDSISDADWSAFVRTVRYVLRRLSIVVDSYDDGVLSTADGRRFGLWNIAQACAASPRRVWNDMVHHHFVVVADVLQTPTRFDRDATMVRLYPAEGRDPVWDTLYVTRPFADGVVEVVVLDSPTTVRVVRRDELDAYGVDEHELWDEAWERTRQIPRPEHHDMIDANGAAIHSLFGSDFLTSSLVRFLPDIAGPVGVHGAIVAIPRRNTVLAHVITDVSCAIGLNTMVVMASKLFDDGPGAISRGVYWWRDGTMERLPAALVDGTITFTPPDAFIDMLFHVDGEVL